MVPAEAPAATRWKRVGADGGVHLLHRSTLAALAPLVLATVVLGSGPWAATAPVRGAALTYEKLLKLRTTASALHTTAHPDDEHGGVITRLSRGLGARLALLTLNRGEAGDNAIGPELFDGLGLIRTEELLLADRYYGVDDQYFTTVIDYGYSKRLDEALAKWGKEHVQRDVVRAIRLNRPFVLISRFQGNPRDGHGQHQAAGLVTREAFAARRRPRRVPRPGPRGPAPLAALQALRRRRSRGRGLDPGHGRRPVQPLAGRDLRQLRPHRPLLPALADERPGGARPAAPRSATTSGWSSTVAAPDKEESFFDGIDTSLPGLFKTLGRPAPAGAAEALADFDREVAAAFAAFRIDDPAACVPALARGLLAARRALAASAFGARRRPSC